MDALPIPAGSPTLVVGFVLLAALVVIALATGTYAAARRLGLARPMASRSALLVGGAVAFVATLAVVLADRGALRFAGAPPTMVVAIVVVVALTVALVRSAEGRRLATGLPLAALVGFQGFRVAVELLLHRAYVEGLMPVQMSYAGRNFDIVTGLSAIALGAWLASGRGGRWLVQAWNALGLLLLANVVTIALLSAPTRFRVFHNEPSNVWVTGAPWVLLPLVMVPAALLGHLLVHRRLQLDAARIDSDYRAPRRVEDAALS